MGTYIKPVTRINHIQATGKNFSLQLFSATIMIVSGAFLLTLFVLSGAKVIGKGKDVFRQADFTEDIAIMGNGGSIFWLVKINRNRQPAADACAKHGGKLASLNTQKKIDFVISKVLGQIKTTTWIGAKCEKCETDQNVAADKWLMATRARARAAMMPSTQSLCMTTPKDGTSAITQEYNLIMVFANLNFKAQVLIWSNCSS